MKNRTPNARKNIQVDFGVRDMNSKMEDRIREAAKKVGGIRALSEKSGIGERTIANWLTGTDPRVHALHAVAAAAGVSIDWLVTGIVPEGDAPKSPGPAEQINQQLLTESLFLIEDWLDTNDRTMEAARRAEVAATIYVMAAEDAGGGNPAVNPGRVAQILRLVV